jgi:hypothetical protein
MIGPEPSVGPLIDRLRSEYTELPSLRLTAAQIRRMCDVDPLLCEAVLGALVEVGFLRRRGDGMYVRGPTDLTAARVRSVPVVTASIRPYRS